MKDIKFMIHHSRAAFFENAQYRKRRVWCREGYGEVLEITTEGFHRDGPVMFVKLRLIETKGEKQ